MRHLRLTRILASLALVVALPTVALAQTSQTATKPPSNTATNGTALGSSPGLPPTIAVSSIKPAPKHGVIADAGKIEIPFGTGQRSAFTAGQGFDYPSRPQDAGRW